MGERLIGYRPVLGYGRRAHACGALRNDQHTAFRSSEDSTNVLTMFQRRVEVAVAANLHRKTVLDFA